MHDKLIETHFSIMLNWFLPHSQRYVLKGVYASHTFILEMFETFNEVFIDALNDIRNFRGDQSPIYVENTHFQEFPTDAGPEF